MLRLIRQGLSNKEIGNALHIAEATVKFKGKFPLTICRLTPRGKEALAGYSKTVLKAFQKKAVR